MKKKMLYYLMHIYISKFSWIIQPEPGRHCRVTLGAERRKKKNPSFTWS